ncbi:MAG: DUF4249 domain-containing protein [Bacteroidota bacterium]
MKKVFYLFIILITGACKEKYVPPFEAPANGYLVVEGNINNGNTTTSLQLTRTSTLSATGRIYEQGAIVTIEGKDNSVVLLPEQFAGHYTISSLNLAPLQEYRLHIKIKAGKEYLSDYVAVKASPVIDSLTWERTPEGVETFVNAHDNLDATRYYLWDYVETWEFHSPYLKVLKYKNNTVEYIDSTTYGPDRSIMTCWSSRSSTNILLGSTAKLNENKVYLPVCFVPKGSKDISVLYSINVRQFALSKEAFEFLEKMKKNTESTGSIFDPQPSELKGNIRSVTDPNEPVIGFVNISSLQEKRLFIYNNQLPGWNHNYPCLRQEIQNHPDSVKLAIDGGYFPTEVNIKLRETIVSFFVTASQVCYDCTLSGTNVKPVFWP